MVPKMGGRGRPGPGGMRAKTVVVSGGLSVGCSRTVNVLGNGLWSNPDGAP